MVIELEESDLSERSAVNCSQMVSVQQAGTASRLRPPRGKSDVEPIGHLGMEKLSQTDEVLKFNLALD